MARRTFLARRRIIVCVAVATAVASLVACASLTGIDQYAIGSCKGGEPCSSPDDGGRRDGSASDTSDTSDRKEPDSGPRPVGCPTTAPGPSMVQVGTPDNAFCIDSTETTAAQYDAFLATNPSTANQPAECAWNTTFTPEVDSADDLPQVHVDWCDALAYCTWAGKRLCGKIVDGVYPGTPLSAGDLGSAELDQWYIACSAGGAMAYPYGSTLQSGACNVNTGIVGSPKPPGAYPGCVGGSAGIVDMVGNVWEWIDHCVAAPDSPLPEKMICYSRGGSFGTNEDSAKCDFNGTLARRSGKNDQIGIRCCAETRTF